MWQCCLSLPVVPPEHQSYSDMPSFQEVSENETVSGTVSLSTAPVSHPGVLHFCHTSRYQTARKGLHPGSGHKFWCRSMSLSPPHCCHHPEHLGLFHQPACDRWWALHVALGLGQEFKDLGAKCPLLHCVDAVKLSLMYRIYICRIATACKNVS